MLNKTKGDLTADEYVSEFIPGFVKVALDYHQCLLELEYEAWIIAVRYGLANKEKAYPIWVWDRVFGD